MIKKSLPAVLTFGVLIAICTGCTHPRYTRSVVRNYNAKGKLVGTSVVETVQQMDPYNKSLLPVIEKQTYKK
jgi:hypothetical protein